VDTAYFKGNYPDRCSIQAACLTDELNNIEDDSKNWNMLLPEQKLEMDREHLFENEIAQIGAVSHIRLNIYPDGGVSRLRLLGTVSSCI